MRVVRASALAIAAQRGDLCILEKLLKHNTDLCHEPGGYTALKALGLAA
jgi:hypothetical protein